jgi:predicted transcriptional regulator
MEVLLSTEQEAQLSQIAAQEGRAADELAREALERFIAEEAHFRAPVQAGREAAAREDFVPTAEVWARVERILQS